MWMSWESAAAIDTVLIEHSQRSKVLKLGVIIVGEGEGMVGVKPSVICVPAICRTAGYNFCVCESFRHGVFDDVYGGHRSS